jgi:hypothetical protein
LDLSTHYMALQFYRYQFKNDSFQKRVLHNTILLPVPIQLVEALNIQYNESSLGAIRGQLSDLAGRGDIEGAAGLGATLLTTTAKNVGAMVTGGISGLKDSIREAGSSLGIGLLAAGKFGRGGTGAVAAGLNRFFGSAPNPMITTLFQGVGLRSHSFNWKLAPSSQLESDALAAILDSLRASALPGRGLANFTLNFPDECEIYIMGTTGAPTAVTLDLQLGETVLHTREDYEPSTNFIGAKDIDPRQALENAGGLVDKTITSSNLFQGIRK